MTAPITAPAPTAAEQIGQAIRDRRSTDYVFDFWSAVGWTVLTFGLYSFYVFYQLMRRSRDHNRRRLELLSAAHDLAWQQAGGHGGAGPLEPQFAEVRRNLESLRRMTGDFRDPTLWLLFSIIGGGLVWIAGGILIDQDLVRHERHERAAEAGLTAIFGSFGVALPAPLAATKQPHNYVGRILAVVFSLGLYSLWWVADLMREGNANFHADEAWEDALDASLMTTASV